MPRNRLHRCISWHDATLVLLLAVFRMGCSQEPQVGTSGPNSTTSHTHTHTAANWSLDGCPKWLFDYIKFHKEQRENASAFRLTWTDEDMPRGTYGYGDRLRAAVHGLRSAAASGRVFHLVWMNAPIDITRPFQLNMIDWRPLPGQEKISSGLTPSFVKNATLRSIFYGGNSYCSWEPPSWLFTTPPQWVSNFTEPKNLARLDFECGCVFRALFRPSEELEELVDEEINRTLPNGTTRFAGVHYRSYAGLQGEGENAPPYFYLVNGTLSNNDKFMKTVQCVRERTRLPVFMAVSDVDARRAIKRGELGADVVGPSQEWAIHPNVDKDSNRPPPDVHMHTFVEIGVLSRATVGVWSQSGFSNLARWMQGKGPEYNYIIDRAGDRGCWSFNEIGGPSMV